MLVIQAEWCLQFRALLELKRLRITFMCPKLKE